MSRLIVVENDKVQGTDTHNVSGTGTDSSTSSPAPFQGTAEFDYKGSMTDELSDFLSIDGKPVALVSSKSSLDPGEDSTGGHAPLNAKNITVITPATITPGTEAVSKILDPIGTGIPSMGTGSAFVKIVGDAVLFDGDSIDTCDGLGGTANSTVTAENQDFVSCAK